MKTEETRRASSPTIACAFPSSLSVTARDLTVSHTSRIEQELDLKTGSVSHGGLFPSYDSCCITFIMECRAQVGRCFVKTLNHTSGSCRISSLAISRWTGRFTEAVEFRRT